MQPSIYVLDFTSKCKISKLPQHFMVQSKKIISGEKLITLENTTLDKKHEFLRCF